MKYHAIPCNTIKYNTIPAVRIDNCAGWRAWNPDAGSAGRRASRLAACHRNSLQSLLQNLLITIRFETAPWGNTRVGVTAKTVFPNPWSHWWLTLFSPFCLSLNLDQPNCCSVIVLHMICRHRVGRSLSLWNANLSSYLWFVICISKTWKIWDNHWGDQEAHQLVLSVTN